MPITSSAKKALRQNKTRRARNLKTKENYKKIVVRYRKLAAAKSIDEAKKILPLVFKALDKAAKNNIIAKNKASRLKSRLSHLTAKA